MSFSAKRSATRTCRAFRASLQSAASAKKKKKKKKKKIRFARKVPGGLVYQEAQFAASTQVHRARLVFLTTNRVTSRRQLLQQRLRLLQIARVEPFGEPTVIDAVAGMPDSENGDMAIDDFFGDAAAIALLDTLGALPP